MSRWRSFFFVFFAICCLHLLQWEQVGAEKQWLFQPESKWDREWKSGEWDYLETVSVERGKVAVIGGALVQLFASPNASILDMGCGEGSISDFLTPGQRSRYVGVDISSEAIKKAKRTRGGPMKFVHSAAHEFHPRHNFDVILFSDMLYYVEFEKIINQFHQVLNSRGIMLISIFTQRETLMYEQIFQYARDLMEKIDEIDMSGTTRKGKHGKLEKTAFHIEVYRKKT